MTVDMTLDTTLDMDLGILSGRRAAAEAPVPALVVQAATTAEVRDYHALRREVFVHEQRLFDHDDQDDVDADQRTIVLVALAGDGSVMGGVRLHPATPDQDLGWWRGGRLVVRRDARSTASLGAAGVGAALVRAACARAELEGALRFDATIQRQNLVFFERLGWEARESVVEHGRPHVSVSYPIGRIQRLADSTKAALGGLLQGLHLGGQGFVGDDGAPVHGTDLVAVCDAILPSMVERDPEWAGWCAALVNLNDLSAMGAAPVAMLDAVAARDASFARRILSGLRSASLAWEVPVIGGHTQLGVPAALSVTALGRTGAPVPGGGANPGEQLRLTADLGGGWRPGYRGAQWDSSSHRSGEDLRSLSGVVPSLRPTAAKDVSMSGLVGTTGMLAEASGCRAVLDVAEIPAPPSARTSDWLTCFPGFAMVTAERGPVSAPLPGFLSTAICGQLTEGSGVGLRWPDGVITEAISSSVTGMGHA